MENKKKVLVIGPSIEKSKGGMTSVITGIKYDKFLSSKFYISIFPSYIDGNIVKRLLFATVAFLKFMLLYKRYDLFHIHMASL